jgi:hypothetical protein
MTQEKRRKEIFEGVLKGAVTCAASGLPSSALTNLTTAAEMLGDLPDEYCKTYNQGLVDVRAAALKSAEACIAKGKLQSAESSLELVRTITMLLEAKVDSLNPEQKAAQEAEAKADGAEEEGLAENFKDATTNKPAPDAPAPAQKPGSHSDDLAKRLKGMGF